MRLSHYLKPNHASEIPERMLFVDTETKGENINATTVRHRLWFGWALYLRQRRVRGKILQTQRWYRFELPTDFWQWVDSYALSKTRLWVFAHNWNFDAGILNTSKELERLGYRLERYINDRPPFILDFRKDGKTIRLCDTLNYFSGSLASIGESIGIPKLTMPDYRESEVVWDTYCKRDVTVMKDAVLSFMNLIREHDLGNFQPTLASQAFTAFRHKYMAHRILIHDNEPACRLEREGYYGGRTECFYIGDVGTKVYYMDVNSMYPAVMRDAEVPIKLLKYRRQATIDQLRQWLETYAVMARVTVETDEAVYPYRQNRKLIFPIGRFVTVLSTPELQYALNHDHIRDVKEISIHEKAVIFGHYVDELYNLRLQYKRDGNEAFAYMVKILLNSLYGKFGQNGNKWVEVGFCGEDEEGTILCQDTPESEVRRLRVRLGVLQEFQRNGESENSYPAISAHITSFGRMRLWQLIKQAGTENTYYCDTDSIIVNETGYKNLKHLVDPNQLGALKLEGVFEKAVFWGLKDYRLGDEEKHKGIRKSARQIGDNKWEQEQFCSWDYHLGKGQDGYIDIRLQTKTLHRIYTKGIRSESGRVTPITIME